MIVLPIVLCHYPKSRPAEQEVLEDVITWCCDRYPDRFSVVTSSTNGVDDSSGSIVSVSTHTPGYERTFIVSEYSSEPLRLAGMLVQSDSTCW